MTPGNECIAEIKGFRDTGTAPFNARMGPRPLTRAPTPESRSGNATAACRGAACPPLAGERPVRRPGCGALRRQREGLSIGAPFAMIRGMSARDAMLPMLWALAAPAFAEEPTFEALNKAFGAEIWADDNLWDDADADAAARVKVPQESKTATLSSYRLYAGADVRWLGARPFSVALYGEEGKAARFSIVFLNKGDVSGSFITSDLDSFAQDKDARKAMQEKMKKALAELTSACRAVSLRKKSIAT